MRPFTYWMVVIDMLLFLTFIVLGLPDSFVFLMCAALNFIGYSSFDKLIKEVENAGKDNRS